MKNPNRYTSKFYAALFCATGLFVASFAFAAGGDSSAGGHGVLNQGKIEFLDLLTQDQASLVKKIDVVGDPAFAEALNHLRKILAGLLPPSGDSEEIFYKTLIENLAQIEWYFSENPLEQVKDHQLDLDIGKNVLPLQLAVQDESGHVVVNSTFFGLMDVVQRSALIFHEGLLYKLGTYAPREMIRKIGRLVYDLNLTSVEKRSKIREILNPIHTAILKGEYEMELEYSDGFYSRFESYGLIRLAKDSSIVMNYKNFDVLQRSAWSSPGRQIFAASSDLFGSEISLRMAIDWNDNPDQVTQPIKNCFNIFGNFKDQSPRCEDLRSINRWRMRDAMMQEGDEVTLRLVKGYEPIKEFRVAVRVNGIVQTIQKMAVSNPIQGYASVVRECSSEFFRRYPCHGGITRIYDFNLKFK